MKRLSQLQSVRRGLAAGWRRCSDAAAAAPPQLVGIERIPSVLLVVGDSFVEDNFSSISTDPRWLGDEVLRQAESFYWENGPGRFENLAAWKPFSATTHYLCCTYNLKAIAWSRHPLNTSRMVYTLLNDHKTQSHATTVVPHYHIDRLREFWSRGNTPFYFQDTQGHSATFRASLDFVGQSYEYKGGTGSLAKPPPKECYLPEMFAVVAGVEDDWKAIKSNPPSVIDQYLDEAKQVQDPNLKDALPVTRLLNLLVDKYDCKIHSQMVTNNNLKAITFTLECPHALHSRPRVPRERQIAAS
ncbi:hypothetical protein DIPPA_32622 [Diplonema papillatum]|nr:hypothetical protein DIPPA_32622 [Diplonema papillatum]